MTFRVLIYFLAICLKLSHIFEVYTFEFQQILTLLSPFTLFSLAHAIVSHQI